MGDEIHIPIASDADMVPARAEGRALALALGFSRTDATLIATAISEVARNIVVHVGSGEVVMKPVYEDARYGIVVIARDEGPGIRDVEAALGHGYTGRGGLGLGLPGARRLMDEFDIESDSGSGTTVTMTKWRARDELERLREKRRKGTTGPSF
ncbi:MAG: ATP-binding protein [Actinomycetota bacterium]|nr:ATP-binding protein [Actinomycetota bacterium]